MGVEVLGREEVECEEVLGRELTPGVVMVEGAHARQLVKRGPSGCTGRAVGNRNMKYGSIHCVERRAALVTATGFGW